jgi:hypothetical protein
MENKKTNLISLSGLAGSGKDTVGQIVQWLTSDMYKIDNFTFEEWLNFGKAKVDYDHKWEIKKFATPLKQIASILTGVPMQSWEKQEFKKRDMGPEWGMTYREFLQKLGTDAIRNGLHKEVWVNALFSDFTEVKIMFRGELSRVRPCPNWVITDTRFENELKAVKDRNGITIRVIRPRSLSEIAKQGHYNLSKDGLVPTYTEHPSETAIDDADFHYEIINDAGIPELIEKVKEILTKENII